MGITQSAFKNEGMSSTSVNNETHNCDIQEILIQRQSFEGRVYVARKGQTRNTQKFQREILKEADHSDSFIIKGSLILKWTSNSERV